ncbi:hypothetical protein GCK32_019185 [Trichostrongylus colubriformis]|uniref:Uncharacterized protein n=1 Tax=Trichostrongylus colubriformis TaxID=6319 RepID=A0AAN8FE00_TRICO
MGEEPSKCASGKKEESSKMDKNPEEKSSWLGPVNRNKDQDEKESDSRKVALEPPPPQQDSSATKAQSLLPPSPSQAQKPTMSKFGTIEVRYRSKELAAAQCLSKQGITLFAKRTAQANVVYKPYCRVNFT